METEEISIELRLAAIITLLSSSALRGVTPAKAAALQVHLEAISFAADQLAPYLKEAAEQALAHWQAVRCHPASVSVDYSALAVSGPSLH